MGLGECKGLRFTPSFTVMPEMLRRWLEPSAPLLLASFSVPHMARGQPRQQCF